MTVKGKRKANGSGKRPCDVCGTPHFLEIHHIHGRKIHDYDKKFNLANLCGCCHNSVHRGTIIIEGWFMGSTGMELIWHNVADESITGNDAHPHLI